MPSLIVPDIATMFAKRADGVRVYAKDLNEQFPLYRHVKAIGENPILGKRRAAHLTWVIHEKRLVRGGDCWLLVKENPELHAFIEAACTDSFDLSYVVDTFGFTLDQLQDLIDAEQAKYKK